MKKHIGVVLVSLFIAGQLFSQTTYSAGLKVPQDQGEIRTGEEGLAAQEFRRGVQAYYKGAYNEAIVQFERALTYLPNDNLILEWLGKAYYKSGLEGSALSYWQTCSENGYGGLLLQNRIEIVRERRVTGDSSDKLMRLSEAGTFYGKKDDGTQLFSGPLSVLADKDGSFLVTTYNTNQICRIDINGFISDRITGPLTGFDRPVDIIRLNDGNLLVSESAGNRLSLLDEKGHFIKYIGEKGHKKGGMVGPQYLATDSTGRIYVTDFGNRRVDVFDKEGEGLFSFGGKYLKCPTGIAVYNDTVFVAEQTKGCIYEFDKNGNYLRELVEPKTFKKPEAIKVWQGNLVVCDSNRIVGVSPDTGALFEFARTGNAPSRVTTATPDINNNVIVTDFAADEIYVMSKVQELVGGLFVQIDGVDASKFPEVTVELKVENRHRQPVVGLQQSNFYFTENKRPVNNLSFLGSAHNNKSADITLIIDRSKSTTAYKSQIEAAVKEIASSMEKVNAESTLRVVSAGAIPATEYVGKPGLLGEFNLDALKTPPCVNSAIDLAIRLASNDLINSAKKRSIIVISDGEVNTGSFAKYNLAELTSYMANNTIGFSFVQVNQASVAEEYSYIIENTTGELYYVFRPEGLSSIINDIIDIPLGVYQLKYVSALGTNFGENYLPVEAEVYNLNRSGRDETGYFAPLQ